MKSIQDYGQKIKSRKRLLLPFIAVLTLLIIVALISFVLGRLSVNLEQNEQDVINIEYPPTVAKYKAETGNTDHGLVLDNQYVVSISGTKYYTLDCSGVSRIKEGNKTYFNSVTEAENAGYSPAMSCF